MAYKIMGDDGSLLDARFSVDGADIIMHSRGGARSASPVNPDYAAGLRLLLARLHSKGLPIAAGWVDSSRVQALALADRQIFGADDKGSSPAETFRLLTTRMQAIGRQPGVKPTGGNPTERIRLHLEGERSAEEIVRALQGVSDDVNTPTLERLPASELEKVTGTHIANAILKWLGGSVSDVYGPSTDYDLLLAGGVRLPPKAIFGMAASEALGFPVLPRHFSAGVRSPCFRILKRSGGNPPIDPQQSEVEFPPERKFENEAITIHREPDHGDPQARGRRHASTAVMP